MPTLMRPEWNGSRADVAPIAVGRKQTGTQTESKPEQDDDRKFIFNPNSALLLAAQSNRTAVCEKLPAKGARVNDCGERGETALSWAVERQTNVNSHTRWGCRGPSDIVLTGGPGNEYVPALVYGC